MLKDHLPDFHTYHSIVFSQFHFSSRIDIEHELIQLPAKAKPTSRMRGNGLAGNIICFVSF